MKTLMAIIISLLTITTSSQALNIKIIPQCNMISPVPPQIQSMQLKKDYAQTVAQIEELELLRSKLVSRLGEIAAEIPKVEQEIASGNTEYTPIDCVAH